MLGPGQPPEDIGIQLRVKGWLRQTGWTKRRSAATLAVLFWLFTFGLLTVRAHWAEDLGFAQIAPRRALVAMFGALLCYAAAVYFECTRFRSFSHRVVVGFSVALLMALLLTLFHRVTYGLIDPLPGFNSDFYIAVEWFVSWFGCFLTWTGIHLALLYHWDVEDERSRSLRLREQAQEAQIAALRYQINPHFLFNTLNSISALVIENDRDKAEQMIVTLSDYFRATLAASPSRLVPLREEIELQLLYLKIEAIRFEGRMRIETRIPADLLDILVPPLILQPILENAVRHGVECSERPTLIAIGASRTGGALRLVVENSGDAAETCREGAHVGLRNVAARLEAHYGESAFIRTEALIGSGFRATMDLPAGG